MPADAPFFSLSLWNIQYICLCSVCHYCFSPLVEAATMTIMVVAHPMQMPTPTVIFLSPNRKSADWNFQRWKATTTVLWSSTRWTTHPIQMVWTIPSSGIRAWRHSVGLAIRWIRDMLEVVGVAMHGQKIQILLLRIRIHQGTYYPVGRPPVFSFCQQTDILL